jgi:glycosyltransferase involved in cell wall biosynthesis
MKVLWFTDSPSLATVSLNLKRNIPGWIESLQEEITKIDGLELGVAFPLGNEKETSFDIANTRYFSYPYAISKKNIIGVWNRWNHKIESESIIACYLKIIEEFNPDVIQIFGTESPFGLMIPLVKAPVVIHIQGNLTITSKKWFSGLSFFSILRNTNIKVLIKAYGLWHLYFNFSNRATRERKLMGFCRYFIGRTDWDRRICKVLSPSGIYYHCEELLRNDFYNVKRWQKPTQVKIKLVSTVSTMVYKGLETILETAQLLSNNLFLKFEWIVAGVKGNEEIIGIIEKTYKLKFADHHIFFKGSLNPVKLIEELSQAHIYVHPSHIENSPNSVCEAMLLGMPVIATYAGGTPSIVENGKEGLLVQDGDPYSMAGAITELIQDDSLMLLLAENAYKKATMRHNRKMVRDRMSEIYKDIIEKSNNKLN